VVVGDHGHHGRLGDPVIGQGRLIAVGFMVVGIAMVGAVTASIARTLSRGRADDPCSVIHKQGVTEVPGRQPFNRRGLSLQTV
jgi:hypothetical protein